MAGPGLTGPAFPTVDGGANPRKSGDDGKSGTTFAARDQPLLGIVRSETARQQRRWIERADATPIVVLSKIAAARGNPRDACALALHGVGFEARRPMTRFAARGKSPGLDGPAACPDVACSESRESPGRAASPQHKERLVPTN